MTFVYDSSALIALVRDEKGAEAVEKLLLEPGLHYIHAVNACEVYYYFLRHANQPFADEVIEDFLKMNLKIQEELSTVMWQSAGLYKHQFKIPLGDAFAIALAQHLKATVVTTDHPDFERVRKAKLCRVEFVR
jgi:PIN domain nuclease of toxin-antitoxin system